MIKKKLTFTVFVFVFLSISTTIALAQSFQSNCSVVKVGNPLGDVVLPSSCTVSSQAPSANVNGKVPLYKQWDERWGSNSYGCGGTTIGSAGCGVASLAMLISYWLNKEVFPSETARIALDNGWRICNKGTSWDAMTGMPRMYGLNAKEIDWEEAKKYLLMGIPIIQSHSAGFFTNHGHFIVLTGYSTGVYFVNDPDGKHRTEATEQQITNSLNTSWVVLK